MLVTGGEWCGSCAALLLCSPTMPIGCWHKGLEKSLILVPFGSRLGQYYGYHTRLSKFKIGPAWTIAFLSNFYIQAKTAHNLSEPLYRRDMCLITEYGFKSIFGKGCKCKGSLHQSPRGEIQGVVSDISDYTHYQSCVTISDTCMRIMQPFNVRN